MMAMIAYDPILNHDHEICRAENLQDLIKKFETMPKIQNFNYYIRKQ